MLRPDFEWCNEPATIARQNLPTMFLWQHAMTDEGDHLHARFKKLGDLPGRSFAEITTHVSLDPEEVTYLDNGTRTYRWSKPGYEITILCDRTDRCIEVMHECTRLFAE